MDIKKELAGLLKKAIEKSKEFAGQEETPAITLERPKVREFGDFSSNAALILGKKTGRPPLEVARAIEKALRRNLARSRLLKKIDKIEIKGPGFINFFLSKNCLYEILSEITKKKDNFGRLKLGKGKNVHMEFVSANPTGPLNVAHARQAAFGDTLANLLQFSGHRVFREYYLNDEGVQIDLLGESLRASYLKLLGLPAEFPVSGYRGRSIEELAEQFLEKYDRKYAESKQKKTAFFSRFAYTRILKQIKEDLKDFAVSFDCWFSQKSLNKGNRINGALELLKKKGFLYRKEGAWWLATTRFGDDKDRVVIKSDGNLTYIAPDIAYHQTKFKRRFNKMINIWGPDHHGYIARLKAAVSALGYDAKKVSVLIVQLVSLMQAEKVIPMSTRQGQFISLKDIIQAVGRDAARFFFLMRKRDAHLNFDLELAKKQTLENPVYYIQYAHARIVNILKFRKSPKKACCLKEADLLLLKEPEELALIQVLGKFPAVVEYCALGLEPHGITTYLHRLAKSFHHYYEKHRVVTDDSELTGARLVLIDAARIVLNNGLRLLAISAPEKM
jgi:arginyl-tRNA synthetase